MKGESHSTSTGTKSQAETVAVQSTERMEPFSSTPYINPAVLTSLPAAVLRKEGERRQQEVKCYEDLIFDGCNIEQIYYMAQSNKAIRRSLRKGVGSTTLRLRPVWDKITIEFNKSS